MSKLAVVLSGGGARAAYQVGVMKYLIEHYPHNFEPRIWCGTSAGAINTAFMAQFSGDLDRGIKNLSEVWLTLHPEDVYKASIVHLLRIATRWVMNFFLSKFIDSARYRSLVDTSPLYKLLSRTIDMERIHRAVREKKTDAVTITATEYGTGKGVIFIESRDPDIQWSRAQRTSRQTELTIDHVMASAAIPFLFPAISVSGIYYGDGSMRDKAPLSPCAKLGADKVLAIGVRSKNASMGEPARNYPSVASIGGTIMNSIFLDSLDTDIENLDRVNHLLDMGSSENYKPIKTLYIRPSQDLGAMALHFVSEIPRVVRHLVHGFGKAKRSSSDFISYIAFSGGYSRALIQLGYDDAQRSENEIRTFLLDEEEGQQTIALRK